MTSAKQEALSCSSPPLGIASKVYRAPSIKKPTVDELKEIATRIGFHMTIEEISEYKEIVDSNIAFLSTIDDLPEPMILPVKYPRTPGYRPQLEENPNNAWYSKTDIQGALSGKLKGKRFAIKDNVAVAGVPMMNGTKLLQGYTPEYDATVVTRILDAGGYVAGKATCENMSSSGSSCTSDTGPVLNPHDVTRSSGGSSSGSGVLVQTGEVDMALGTDQGGSLRIPASWLGIVGLKPTWGLVPFTGIISMDFTVDHVGPLARNVKDLALLLEVLAGYDGGLDSRQLPHLEVPVYSELLKTDLTSIKIGLLKEGFEICHEDVQKVVQVSALGLKAAGATIEDVSIPLHRHGQLIWSAPCELGGHMTMIRNAGCGIGHKGFQSTSFIDHMAKSIRTQVDDMAHITKLVCLQREYMQQKYSCRYYAKGQNLSMMLTKAYDDVLEEYDVVIMPTVPWKAPKFPEEDAPLKEFLQHTQSMVGNTCPFNITGHPALSINAGFSEGLPVGMMIVGKQFDDATVLKVAYAFESIRDAK